MAEAIEWLADGTPYSPRFGDRYHSSAHGGLDQARDTFLDGCALPAAWAHQAQWRILETGFGLGLNFLVTWAAWRADPARSQLLHFVSCEAWPVSAHDIVRAAFATPELHALAQELAAQFWGLLPGVHRLTFDSGRVLLTLYIGDAQAMLRQQKPVVDSVYLDGFSPPCNRQMWSVDLIKSVARCCHLGTRLATWSVARPVRDALVQCGFVVSKVPGAAPKRDNLQATYQPHWFTAAQSAAHGAHAAAGVKPTHCIVLGAGLAGAALAASLARRGWHVRLIDQCSTPGAGASGLPAGLLTVHTSRDDAPLSRLTRAGVRLTLQSAHELLHEGQDWSASGILEHCVQGQSSLHVGGASSGSQAAHDWSRPADACQYASAHLPPDSVALWHVRGGWIRPAPLIAAWLAQPDVAARLTWQGDTQVTRIVRCDRGDEWVLLDAHAQPCAQAPWVFIATGAGGIDLCAPYFVPQALRPLRGQIMWSRATDEESCAMPPYPVNGHGYVIPHVPDPSGPLWVLGSTFERGYTQASKTAHELEQGHAEIMQRVQTLLPHTAQQLQSPSRLYPAKAVHAWTGVRCAAPDRRPVVGAIDAQALPGLWMSTALGARGLTHALLCAELVAAQLHAEPLPLEAKLAQWLDARRLRGTSGTCGATTRPSKE